LKTLKNFEILELDILNSNYLKNIDNKYDIIFLDPPYHYGSLAEILIQISDEKILNKSGIIVIHRHKKEDDKFPINFKILEKKKYGISKIIFGSLN